MAMKTRPLLFILFIIGISSCAYYIAPNYIKQNFTFCNDGKSKGIDSLININGYYSIAEPYSRPVFSTPYDKNKTKYASDTMYQNLMFYRDGLFVIDFFALDANGTFEDDSKIPKFFKQIVENKESKVSKFFYSSFDWGSFRINGDTIKMQYIDRPIFGESRTFWYAWEIWYKVLNRNSIIEIYSNPIHYTTKSDWENYQKAKKEKVILPAKFVPVAVIPSSDCWLKKEKWFWCKTESRD
jgi:hypothetical protein